MMLSASMKDGGELEPKDISRFVASLCPEWIDQALRLSGKASIRRRKLPADKAIWLVIGTALYANMSISRVVEHMRLVVDGLLAPSAAIRARIRLGAEPVRLLFEAIAGAWSRIGEEKWRGLAVYGLDGSHLRVDDSDVNASHFGRPKGGRGVSGYPQLRMVALMNLSSRMLAGAAAGCWKESEVSLARDLWRKVPKNSLTIIDRGFLSAAVLLEILGQKDNSHFLIRLKSTSVYTLTRLLPDGSAIATIGVSPAVRKALPDAPKTLVVRLISYHHLGGQPGILMTSLLDEAAYPADEIVSVYHKRWELEVAFDELKTHFRMRREALRSRTVEGVYQEFWALMVAYNLLRREMAEVAVKYDVSPSRISFTGALILVHNFFAAAAVCSRPGVLPAELADLDLRLGKSMILPERRSDRRLPRQVKIKMSNYKKAPPRTRAVA